MAEDSETLQILMADDSPDDRRLIETILQRHDYPCQFAAVSDGLELLQYLRHEGAFADAERHPRPDLILLDLNMPHLDGREALRQIRSDPELVDVPLIVLSASGEAADFEGSLDDGANFYVSKPIDIAAFMALMQSFLVSDEDEQAAEAG